MPRPLRLALLLLGAASLCLPLYAHASDGEAIAQAFAAVERVRYAHRLWPEPNPAPRPALASLADQAVFESRARDIARRSEALRRYWGVELPPEALQAELDRMARETSQPERLAELFAALGGDARLAAEALARPALVERHLRARYARDPRMHADARRRAASALASRRTGRVDEMPLPRVTIVRDGPAAGANAIALDPVEFAALRNRMPAVGEPPILDETDAAFVIVRTLEETEDGLVLEQESFPKRSLEEWWSDPSSTHARPAGIEPAAEFEFRLPVIGASTQSPCNSWVDPLKIDRLPRARYGHTAVWTGSEMLVWGGTDGSGYPTPLLRYDPATDSWAASSAATDLPASRSQHTAVWTGNEMLVWGGYNPGVSGQYLAHGGRYDPATDSWRPIAATSPAPWPRSGHTAIWTGSEMIVWGGVNWNGDLADGGRYDPSTDSWTTTTMAGAPQPRHAHSAIWTGNEVIVWGGIFGSAYLNSLGRYQPATDSWLSSAYINPAPSARVGHRAVWTGSQMLVWGGVSGTGPALTGGRFDVATSTWLMMAAQDMPTPREAHVAVWIDSPARLLIWGGVNGTALGDGGLYDPATDDWQPVRTEGAPSARQYPAAVWTGNELLVWGGVNGATLRNTGARYDPQADLWTPMAPSVPIGTYRHSAVWTGNEMIVWGGATPNATQAGAAYESATANWTALPVDAATPAPRYEHSAVWTGSEMIVWGGTDTASNYPTVGGAYDPAAGAWRTIDAGAGMPPPRANASAVWTGSTAIFWGGALYTYTGQNTGGIYDPVTNSWTPTAIGANTPSPRYDHTAVWTGEEMLVWGGCCNEPGATGGAFNPSTDSWRAISTTGAPAGRQRHVAVWDGERMIVAGGWSGFNTSMGDLSGGLYDPTGDTWSPISPPATSNDVREVARATAVWTGREMLLWGGEFMSCGGWSCTWPIWDGGGRFDPETQSWAPLGRTGFSPVARRMHTAVWTGSAMLLWGGSGTTVSFMDTGGLWLAAAPASPSDSLRIGKSATVDLTWQPSAWATEYAVRQCIANAGACVPDAVGATTSEPAYSDELGGPSRFFSIEAVNDCGVAP